jgi:hypothetical protein
MTIQVKPQMSAGPLATPVQIRYNVSALPMINATGQSAKLKTVYQYSIVQSAGFSATGMPILIHIPISEGRFKKMQKQHKARNRNRPFFLHGSTRIKL